MTANTTLYELENAPSGAPLLQVKDLHVEFTTREGIARAVNGVNFTVELGKTLAVLGESGSGKSVTAQAVMGIVDDPPGKVTGGEVLLHGVDILKLSAEERRLIRGERIAMIFQDALSSLNPTFTVGWQISELFRVRRGLGKKESQAKALELMERVSIPAAKQRFNNYPHEFSGGMRQRVMIAMALALEPEVLIADEPTTALDVTVQAQILDLLKDLQNERNMGLILITHDLGVVAEVADRIAVMYAGRIVEHASVRDLFARPAHPYSLGLIDSIPRLDDTNHQLRAIGGLPPSLTRLPVGCAFHPRCRFVADPCLESTPDEVQVSPDQSSRCFFAEEVFHGRR
ncbi:MAG: oligopeptide transport system ATP-binding protein [Actinomycetota bacterium]|jgi:oligopeptide transport system ATP-binding protein|nr:oligopeptide transport system ATP-binding protein [Actinomycetota bacterium]